MEIGMIGLCFCSVTLLPSVSHDYKLVIHIIPLILLLSRSWEELFDSKKEAYWVTAIISIAVAYLFIPRYEILPFRIFNFPENMTGLLSMKTSGLFLAFMGYGYLAIRGNTKIDVKDVQEIG